MSVCTSEDETFWELPTDGLLLQGAGYRSIKEVIVFFLNRSTPLGWTTESAHTDDTGMR